MHIIVSGAYGRTYKSKAAILKDWLAGKDFRVRSINVRGSYCSVRDMAAMSISRVEVRFNKDVDLCVLEQNTETGEWS